jgi:hypothetical protein
MAWGTFTQSDWLTVDANFEFLVETSDPLVIALNPRETVSLKFNIDAAGTTDDLEIEVLQGHQISTGNTLDGATSTTDVELDTAADGFSTDDDMNGTYILFITSGSARGEGRLITDSVAADDGVNLSHAVTAGVAASDPYALYRFAPVRFTLDPQTTIDSDNQNNAEISVSAINGQYVAVVARATGATDAHRVRMSYQTDGVSI